MPKGDLEVVLSPEFLIMMPIAATIDLIGIILVIFGLDDFWITDIIAWVFIGGWGLIRGQIMPAPGAQPISVPPSPREFSKNVKESQKAWIEAKKTAQEAAKGQKAAKSAKWAKRIKWLEFIPYVGALPLWSVSVYMTIKYS